MNIAVVNLSFFLNLIRHCVASAKHLNKTKNNNNLHIVGTANDGKWMFSFMRHPDVE